MMTETTQEQSRIEDIGVELDPEIAPIPVVGFDQSIEGGAIENSQENGNPLIESTNHEGEKGENEAVTHSVSFADLDDGANDVSFTERDHVIMNSKPTQYAYFKPTLLQKAWTGPDHWKLNRVPKKHQKTTHEHKKHTRIQFSPDCCIKPSNAFPAVKRTSDLIMNETVFEAKGFHILPEDHHYSFEVVISDPLTVSLSSICIVELISHSIELCILLRSLLLR